MPVAADSTSLDGAGLVRSIPSAPRSGSYKGSWTKHIYTTPFEGVDGEMAARFRDPLHEESWKSTASFSNLTSVGPDGKTRVSARISCCETPLDPIGASFGELLMFLVRWTLPGVLGSPQILYQALRIKYTGLMSMTERPVIQRGSIPRKASSIERFGSYSGSKTATATNYYHTDPWNHFFESILLAMFESSMTLWSWSTYHHAHGQMNQYICTPLHVVIRLMKTPGAWRWSHWSLASSAASFTIQLSLKV